MKEIKDINPLKDEWDLSMLSKFDNKQLINALHKSLDSVFKPIIKKNKLSGLARLFFNDIIHEIEKRMINK